MVFFIKSVYLSLYRCIIWLIKGYLFRHKAVLFLLAKGKTSNKKDVFDLLIKCRTFDIKEYELFDHSVSLAK